MLAKVGVIHGRFQPLHHGHMEYLLAGKSRCEYLVVGIANPDTELTADNPVNPARSLPLSNPFTYYERFLMLRDALLDAGVKRDEFDIMPFPINHPHLLYYYVPMDALFFVTIYDDWGCDKVRVLQSLNLQVDVMWERKMSERITSGVEVRKLIASGDDKWERLIPQAVAKIIKERGLDIRIRQMTGSGV